MRTGIGARTGLVAAIAALRHPHWRHTKSESPGSSSSIMSPWQRGQDFKRIIGTSFMVICATSLYATPQRQERQRESDGPEADDGEDGARDVTSVPAVHREGALGGEGSRQEH